MDLLGGYGDDGSGSGSEAGEQVAAEGSAQKERRSSGGGSAKKEGMNSLVDYLQGIGGEDGEGSDGSPSGKEKSSGKDGSKLGDDGTPSSLPKRRGNLMLRAVSKSSTPLISSPALAGAIPSDASSPNSPEPMEPRSNGSASLTADKPPARVELPPEPSGEIDPRMMVNVQRFTDARSKGKRVNADLYDKKEFHNPGVLEELVNKYNIKETGSNYPKELFDPAVYADRLPQLFYDNLRRQQDTDARKREDAKAGRTAIDFSSGGKETAPGNQRKEMAQASGNPRKDAAPGAGPRKDVPVAGGGAGNGAKPAGTVVDLTGAGGESARKRSKWDLSNKAPVPAGDFSASTGVAATDLKRVQAQLGANK
mmetsp:Transcript_66380/g.157303  ORF Transcript_66380/g.157303 Transcript_66380/m.157303 type:complete len:366 (-) Transcript_66380:19-1116(-)